MLKYINRNFTNRSYIAFKHDVVLIRSLWWYLVHTFHNVSFVANFFQDITSLGNENAPFNLPNKGVNTKKKLLFFPLQEFPKLGVYATIRNVSLSFTGKRSAFSAKANSEKENLSLRLSWWRMLMFQIEHSMGKNVDDFRWYVF